MPDTAGAPLGPGQGRLADAAGVFGAVVAALCCAGTPLIVGALAAAGLSSLRRDSILWPVMLVSLAVAVWGFWQGRRFHRHPGPLRLGALGAVSLALGVIVVHGPPAMNMIYGGAIFLVVATLWNLLARRRRLMTAPHPESSRGVA
jgi:mercuric ion transport protein